MAARLATFLVMVVACGKGEPSKVVFQAGSYCHRLERDLATAAEKLATNGPDGGFPLASRDENVRAAMELEVSRQFAFCTLIRRGDNIPMIDRFQLAGQTFRESRDPAKVNAAITEMAKLAEEINRLAIDD